MAEVGVDHVNFADEGRTNPVGATERALQETVVLRVGNVDVPCGVDCHPPGPVEVSVVCPDLAGCANCGLVDAAAIEDLDSLVAAIYDEDVAIGRVDGDSGRAVELVVPRAIASERAYERPG